MWDILNHPLIDTSSPLLEGYWWFYVPFNTAEAAAWFGFAVFILGRYIRHRKSWYELLYAASFVLFGITGVIETHSTTLWLLGFKGACLLAILQGRKLVVGHYPGAKI